MVHGPQEPTAAADPGSGHRTRTETHDTNPHSNVGAYVVDALEPAERAEFRAHLDSCPSCRREVTEFAETAAELAMLVEATPPAALRRQTLASIGAVRPLPPLAVSRPPVPPPPPADVAPLDDHPSVMPWSLALGAPVTPTPARPGGRRRTVVAVVVALLCAALLFFGGWLAGNLGARQSSPPVQPQSALLAASDAELITSTVSGSPVTYLVSRERDGAALIASELPAPAAGRVYQLWILDGDRAEPAGLLRAGGSVEASFTGSLAGADALAISAERAPDGTDRPGSYLSRVPL